MICGRQEWRTQTGYFEENFLKGISYYLSRPSQNEGKWAMFNMVPLQGAEGPREATISRTPTGTSYSNSCLVGAEVFSKYCIQLLINQQSRSWGESPHLTRLLPSGLLLIPGQSQLVTEVKERPLVCPKEQSEVVVGSHWWHPSV